MDSNVSRRWSRKSGDFRLHMNTDIFKRAPHNPPHLFLPDTYYMLTASTFRQESLLLSPQRKMEWLESFLNAANIYQWQIIAWVILNNHYHAILRSPEKAGTLSKFVGSFHKHKQETLKRQRRLIIVELPGIQFDVDTEEDWTAYQVIERRPLPPIPVPHYG